MQEALKSADYIPGSCNIGSDEVHKRQRIGYIGLAMMILFITLAEVYRLPQIWKLVLFAPAVYAFSGFLQARQKFCYIYGWKGVFSIIGKRKLSRVKDDHDLQQDRRMAIRIVLRILLGSMILTLMYYFLSNLVFNK